MTNALCERENANNMNINCYLCNVFVVRDLISVAHLSFGTCLSDGVCEAILQSSRRRTGVLLS